MINYDFHGTRTGSSKAGRIHRIGQADTCRLWNLVAEDTREGQVFTRLLQKMETQRRAYGGRLFDVLGEAFKDQPAAQAPDGRYPVRRRPRAPARAEPDRGRRGFEGA